MADNEKYKLLGFDCVRNCVNLMVINTGRILSIPFCEIRNSNVMDDINKREIESIYRKIYSSGYQTKTEYEFSERPERQWFFYVICCMMMFICYIFSNFSAIKPVYIERFNLIITPGTFVYPFTFLIVDILNEFYGFRRARNAIFLCACGNAAILGMLTASMILPSVHDWAFNKNYSELIKQIQTTFLASTVSFIVSELVNSKVLCFIKRITNSNYLYIRIISSIFIASILDSFIFCFIAFYNLMTVKTIISMALIQIVIKLCYAIFNVFPAYGARYLFNRYLAGR